MSHAVVRAIGAGVISRRLLTVEDFEAMGEAGILGEDESVELIDGVLVAMAAKGAPHVACVIRTTDWFAPRIAGRASISVPNSLRLTDHSEPEPDIALLTYRDYATALPQTEDVSLVIEISDTTLVYDRDVKIPRYADAGIREVWIFDLKRRRNTVYRDPSTDGYNHVMTLTRRAILSPLALPEIQLRWEDIFGAE